MHETMNTIASTSDATRATISFLLPLLDVTAMNALRLSWATVPTRSLNSGLGSRGLENK